MLRDITIGQHFPGNSLVHKFDPRLKLVLTIAYIILLFAASNPLGLALSILFLVGMYAVAKIPFKLILKSLKPILPIVVFTAVLNLFFVSGEGEPLVHIGFLTVYAEGVKYAILMAVRVMALIAGTSCGGVVSRRLKSRHVCSHCAISCAVRRLPVPSMESPAASKARLYAAASGSHSSVGSIRISSIIAVILSLSFRRAAPRAPCIAPDTDTPPSSGDWRASAPP